MLRTKNRMLGWAMSLVMACALFVPAISVTPASANGLPSITLSTQAEPDGTLSISYSNIQNSFPGTNWDQLQRIYIPAGNYKFVVIGNLPARSSSLPPLIITNSGGQVNVGEPNVADTSQRFKNDTIRLSGGSNWILTGKYDLAAQTGHVSYQGHQNGQYANSAGKYGIVVSHNYATETIGVGGIKINGGATNFKLSHIEVAHTGFAGIMIKNEPDNTTQFTDMDNVKLHDLYIHDTGTEGLYIGNTQRNGNNWHKFTNLEIYNNRIVRTGAEAVQVSHAGDGTIINNNVIFMSNIDWKSPFDKDQDFGMQFYVRTGTVTVANNIVIGVAQKFYDVEFLANYNERNDYDEMNIVNNFFSHSRHFGSYVFGTDSYTTPVPYTNGGTLNIDFNKFSQINYHYKEARDPETSYGKKIAYNLTHENTTNAINFRHNSYQLTAPTDRFIDKFPTLLSDGTSQFFDNVWAYGNVRNDNIQPIQFMDSTFPASFDYSRVERWASTTIGSPYNYKTSIQYKVDDYVVHGTKLYKSLQDHTATDTATASNKPGTPGAAGIWVEQPMPTDDLRLHPTSKAIYPLIGLLD